MGESKALRLGGRLWRRTGGEGARLCWTGGGGGGASREDSGLGGGVGGRGGLRRAPPGLLGGCGRGWMGGRETAAKVLVSGLVRPSLGIVPLLTPRLNYLPAEKHLEHVEVFKQIRNLI